MLDPDLSYTVTLPLDGIKPSPVALMKFNNILASTIHVVKKGQENYPNKFCPACASIKDGKAKDMMDHYSAEHGARFFKDLKKAQQNGDPVGFSLEFGWIL